VPTRGRGLTSQSSAMARPATVFLDRDGTINVKAPEGEYITRPEDLVLLPGAADAVRRLNEAGVEVVVVTNQRGIARGLMSEDDYTAVTGVLADRLAEHGARWRAVFHCPHEAGACRCRKPETGLIDRARVEVPGLDVTGAVLIGDSESDVEAGRRAGLRTVLLADPVSARARASAADQVAPTLAAAVDLLMN
jgi:D-glycero-D-manno-heptose 1,7-bisphosphate phosphatase